MAFGLSDRGRIVGTYYRPDSNGVFLHNFLYDQGVYTTLPSPFPVSPDSLSVVNYSNDLGRIVGVYTGHHICLLTR